MRRGLFAGHEDRLIAIRTLILDQRRPGPRTVPDRRDPITSSTEVVLRGRPVGYRAGIVVNIGAHRAARQQQPRHTGEQACPTYGSRRLSKRLSRRLSRRLIGSDRVQGFPPLDRKVARPVPIRSRSLPASRQRLFPHPCPVGLIGPLGSDSSAKPPQLNRKPKTWAGRRPKPQSSTPRRAIRTFMSSQTSRLAAGFRSR